MYRDEIITSSVMKCLAVVETSLVIIDVIEYRNKLWLVPEWLDSPDGLWCAPRRIIYAGQLRHLRAIGAEGANFALDRTLTDDVLNGISSNLARSNFQIIDLPLLRIRKPRLH
jgi:hypothetical protein